MKIYLAGPLFTWGEREQNRYIAAELRGLGHEVFVPQETEQRSMAPESIFNSDVAGLEWAEVIVACVDGPDPDSGTSWELGYMFAKAKHAILYRSDFRTACAEGMGCLVNLMLAVPAEDEIHCQHATPRQMVAYLQGALVRLAAGG